MSDTVATDIKIREATKDDVDFLAWVMLTASRSHVEVGLWEYIFAFDETQTLAFLSNLCLADTVQWCHYSLFQIAEIDGAAAGGLCGYHPVTQGMEQLMAEIPGAALAAGLEPEAFTDVMTRSEIVGRITSEPEPGSFVVENVATRPEFRRRGVIDALLRSILDRGRDNGHGSAQISVFIGNDPAHDAYVKAGFTTVDEKRDAEFEAALHFPGFDRMLQQLS